MSDSFISSLFALGVGESITYVASTPASRDKVRNLAESASSKQFAVNVTPIGEKFRLTITRLQ